MDELGSFADQTAEQLGWANKPLIGVSPERPAIDAMELMVEKGISAVAVLGRNDKLIGNFSVSELRYDASGMSLDLMTIHRVAPQHHHERALWELGVARW